MCNVAGLGAVLSIAQTAFQVTSSIQQANAQKAQYAYDAQIAKNNARIAQQNADQKRQEGIEEERLTRIKALQNVGSQKAAIAANNIDVSSGNAVDALDDTYVMGDLDALTKRYNYETAALGYEQQANNYVNQANLDSFAKKTAGNTLGIIGTTIGGLADTTSVASKWYNSNSVANKFKNRVSGGTYGDGSAYV